MKGQPQPGCGEMMAEAMAGPGADQRLDDMLFDQHHTERSAHVGKQPRKAVVEIGIDQDLDILSGDQPEGGDGRLRGGDVVVPVGQSKREILAEIADRGRAGCERMFGVVERARQAEHEVAEMGGGGRRAGDPRKVLRSVQDDPCAPSTPRTIGRGITHRPVERDPEPVNRHTAPGAGLVHLHDRVHGPHDTAEADVRVLHDAPARRHRALVVGLAGDGRRLEKRRTSDPPVARDRPSLGQQFASGTQGRRNEGGCARKSHGFRQAGSLGPADRADRRRSCCAQ